MKFCTECGTKADFDEQKFCKVCGHKFPEAAPAPQPDLPEDDPNDQTISSAPFWSTPSVHSAAPEPAPAPAEAPAEVEAPAAAPEPYETLEEDNGPTISPATSGAKSFHRAASLSPEPAAPVEPAAPANEATTFTPVEPAAPAEDATTFTPVEPAAPADDATTFIPVEPAAPADDATTFVPVTPAAPADDATVFTPVEPAAPADDATVFTPVEPAAPADDATVFTPVEPAAPAEDATTFTPVEPAAPVYDTAAYAPNGPAAPAGDETVRAFLPPQDDDYSIGVSAPAAPTADFFAPEAGGGVPPMPPEPVAEAPARKKKSPILLIVLLVVLAALLAVGGFFVWKKLSVSKDVSIGGVSYSIEDTTELAVQDPTDEDWAALCSLPNLTSLTITGSGSTALDENKLTKLTALQKLEQLSADGVTFPDGVSELANLDALDTLALTNCQLTSEQCNGLDGLHGLRKLNLANNQLTDLSFLQGLTGLQELDVSGNQIVDYSPLTALTGLTTLSVDQCQVQVLSTLPALATLTVGGKPIEDTAAYLKEQKETVDLYNSVIGWFESGDYNTLKVVLQQFTNADSLGGAVLSYVNGWLMGSGTEWDAIKSSLPAGTKEVLVDTTGLYYGQVVDGKRSGEGIQLFAGNYSVYNGQWSNDLPNGTGTYRKTAADGTTLEFTGTYADGYENGTMTFKATNSTGSQSGTYTAANGSRTTVRQISDSQYAFVQFDNVYWYDASPDGHGVAVGKIAYQEEQAMEILPEPDPVPAASSSSGSGSGSGGRGSSSGSGSSGGGSSAPAASTPPASSSASSDSGDDSGSWTADDIWNVVQLTKDIIDMFS